MAELAVQVPVEAVVVEVAVEAVVVEVVVVVAVVVGGGRTVANKSDHETRL